MRHLFVIKNNFLCKLPFQNLLTNLNSNLKAFSMPKVGPPIIPLTPWSWRCPNPEFLSRRFLVILVIFYPDFPEAPADGQFLSGLGIRPLGNVWTHVRSTSVVDFIECEPRKSNSVHCYTSLVLLILVSKYIINPLHPRTTDFFLLLLSFSSKLAMWPFFVKKKLSQQYISHNLTMSQHISLETIPNEVENLTGCIT